MRSPSRMLAIAPWLALASGLLAACGAASTAQRSSALLPHASSATLEDTVARLAHRYWLTAAKAHVAALFVGTSAQQFAHAVELSPPVMVDGRREAVAAFPYAPGDTPVEVLGFSHGAWSVIERLPGTIDYARGGRSVLLAYPGQVGIGHVAKLRGPALLIRFAGGGCYAGSLIGVKGTQLAYLRAETGTSSSRVIGGDPQFFHETLLTTSDCGATSGSMGNTMTFWRWSAHQGVLVPASTTAIPPADKQALLEGRL
jgi:hypothetical protein